MADRETNNEAKLLLERRFLDLDKGLRKRTKAELVGLILELARAHGGVVRHLEDRLGIEKPLERLVADVSFDLVRATALAEGRNEFASVDWQAYEDLKRGWSS